MALPDDYIDAYLEPCPGYGWAGGPTFSTQIVSLMNGREKRNARWKQPRHTFSAPYQNISQEAFRQIKAMFLLCRGSTFAFRFRDENDFQADQAQFAVADGEQTRFQLGITFIQAGRSFFREVHALANEPIISVDGIAVGSGYTVDLDRGIVEFDTPPASGSVLRWTGDFDVWVRFATDELSFTLDNPDATNGSIELIEVSPPALVE